MKHFLEIALPYTTRHNPDEADALASIFSRILRAIRSHLKMDVAFVSEFIDGRRQFRHVDAGQPDGPVQAGGSDPLEDSYCQRVIDGRLPELIPDAMANAEALTLPATLALPVGAHLSVPIRLSDGRVYGTFCCFSAAPDYTLTERDLDTMRVFSEVLADQIEQDLRMREAQDAVTARIDAMLQGGGPAMVYQPIYDLGAKRLMGFEALARFHESPQRAPDAWFAEAAGVGKAIALETLAIRNALKALDRLPSALYVSVNASPATILHGQLDVLLAGLPLERVVVEVTEHAAVEHYGDLIAAMQPLQRQGLRFAIDDAGAGYASFRHILQLAPYMIKLDMSITRGINRDRARRALAAALGRFAVETGCKIVAEGVETTDELAVLHTLGFTGVQGYLLGHPLKLDTALALCALG